MGGQPVQGRSEGLQRYLADPRGLIGVSKPANRHGGRAMGGEKLYPIDLDAAAGSRQDQDPRPRTRVVWDSEEAFGGGESTFHPLMIARKQKLERERVRRPEGRVGSSSVGFSVSCISILTCGDASTRCALLRPRREGRRSRPRCAHLGPPRRPPVPLAAALGPVRTAPQRPLRPGMRPDPGASAGRRPVVRGGVRTRTRSSRSETGAR